MRGEISEAYTPPLPDILFEKEDAKTACALVFFCSRSKQSGGVPNCLAKTAGYGKHRFLLTVGRNTAVLSSSVMTAVGDRSQVKQKSSTC